MCGSSSSSGTVGMAVMSLSWFAPHKATPPRAWPERRQATVGFREAVVQVALSRCGLIRDFGELARKVRDFPNQPLGPVSLFQALLTFVLKISP
jgi:hypothetical protein